MCTQARSPRTQVEARIRIISRTSLCTHVERLCMHEHKSCTQARVRVRMNQDREVFFDIFKHISIKTYHKHVPTLPKVSGFHLNPSHSKTQVFTSPKID